MIQHNVPELLWKLWKSWMCSQGLHLFTHAHSEHGKLLVCDACYLEVEIKRIYTISERMEMALNDDDFVSFEDYKRERGID